MRTPSNAAVTTLLNQFGQLVWADLYEFTLSSGQKARYTNHDVAITVSGITYGRGPILGRSSISLAIGVAVDTLNVEMTPTDNDALNSVPLTAFLARGGFDGARMQLRRVFAADWASAPAGTITLFSGRVADIDLDRDTARITINSDLEVLDRMIPSNVFQTQCLNTFGDNMCGKSKSALTIDGYVANVSQTRSVVKCVGGGGFATGYFDLGVATFVDGPNAGLSRTVKKYTGGAPDTIEVIYPFPFTPVAGNHLTVYPGCDRTQSTCNTKYANLIRFRGQPYIPVPETVT